MKKKIFILLFIISFLNFLISQQLDIKFIEYKLPNGLKVLLHENHTTPIVAISVLYHVGSKNEDSLRTGFAHFFEHLMFEGTQNIKRGEYLKLIQNAGGRVNANTTVDRTFYYEILPSNKIELGLWMESERMLHSVIDLVGVETQRKVVKEERKLRYENKPYGTVFIETAKHAYKIHPYRWTPIGSDKYIDKANLDEFNKFYNTFYVPNNATLSIAGDINVLEVKKLINKYFSNIKVGELPIPLVTDIEPNQTEEIVDTIYDKIELPAVAISYHIPAQGEKDFYALELINNLLSGGKSALFKKNIIEKKQQSIQIDSYVFNTEAPGLFTIFGIVNKGIDINDLSKSIYEVIDDISNNLISDSVLKKLQNQVEFNYMTNNDKMINIAENLANYAVYYNDANLINTEINKYLSLTKEDILYAAKKYLNKENRTSLFYLPKKITLN